MTNELIRQKAIIDRLRLEGYNRMADHVEEQFQKEVSYSEVWAALRDICEIFQDVAWENRTDPEDVFKQILNNAAQVFGPKK